MIGEGKPNFALDLSNEGVAIWHRKAGGGWVSLGSVSLSSPTFQEDLAALRDTVSKGAGRTRRAVVRIPRTEVLLSKVRVGVFEGDAAIRHAHKQIAALSPYEMHEIAFDLGDKGMGNMAPVGIVARQTLVEANAFAKDNGFEPLYFTTQYAEKEFDREPRFYLQEAVAAAKPLWFVPWVAAASVGLAIGFYGYSYLAATTQPVVAATQSLPEPTQEPAANVASATQAVEPEPESEPATSLVNTTELGLQDVAPALPRVRTDLNAPVSTQYPDLQIASLQFDTTATDPAVTRILPATPETPKVSVSSKAVKTSNLQINEARRDLPEVSVNAEIVDIIQSEMSIGTLDTPAPAQPVVLAALTTPDQTIIDDLPLVLPQQSSRPSSVNSSTQEPAERPAPPPSLVTAEPGTLTPTPEGTLGPDNILIFAGTPPTPPRNRVDPLPLRDQLAGFPPRLRPETLNLPAEVLAAIAAQQPAEPVAEPTLLDLADPELRTARARIRPDSLNIPAIADASTETETTTEEPLLAFADPTLRGVRAPVRPATLAQRAQQVTEQEAIATLGDPSLRPFRPTLRADTLAAIVETTRATAALDAIEATTASIDLASIAETALETAETQTPTQPDEIATAIAQDTVQQAIENDVALLTAADPALRPFRARTRPVGLVSDTQLAALTQAGVQSDATPNTLLALADPTLSGNRARPRPNGLRVISPEEQNSLLALADPTLANKRTRVRPRNLRIIAAPTPETTPEPETETTEAVEEEPVIRGTRQAVAASPKPKTRPRKLARVVQRVQREARRTNAAVQSDSSSGNDSTGVAASGGSTRATASLPKSARGTVKSAPATSSTVARAATEKSRFKKSRMTLVGIFGAPSKRRALIRMPTGRYVKVQTGDRVSGWKISAIGESSLRINKGSRDQVLRIP